MREMPSDAQVMLRDCSLGIWVTLWYSTRYRFTPRRDGRSWTGLLPLLLLAANPFTRPTCTLPRAPRDRWELSPLHSPLAVRLVFLQFPTATRLLCRSPLFALLSFFLQAPSHFNAHVRGSRHCLLSLSLGHQLCRCCQVLHCLPSCLPAPPLLEQLCRLLPPDFSVLGPPVGLQFRV